MSKIAPQYRKNTYNIYYGMFTQSVYSVGYPNSLTPYHSNLCCW